MLRPFLTTLALALSAFTPLSAETTGKASEVVDADTQTETSAFGKRAKRVTLGYGRITSNDLIGDGQDRWRTGSVTMSRVWGYEWTGQAPSRLGDLIETRVQGQIMAPANLASVNLADRPYAGAVSFGLHTHASNRGFDYSLGGELVVIGEQTYLDELQTGLHKLFDKPIPSDAVLAGQIENTFRPTIVTEIGRTYKFGSSVEFRPFVEGRSGDETLVRVGADFLFGSVGKSELLVRESITGQRYRLIYNSDPGFSLMVGGDMAYVSSSVYLPEDRGYTLTSRRDRVRFGVNWQGKNASAFYGMTYLGREFTAQSEGQVVGSIRVKLRF